MAVYKKVSKRTMDLLPVLKNRFPAVEDDIIISVVTLHNNSLIKATEALSEISGVSFDNAIKRGLRRKFKGCNVKVDRRGVPWSKMSLPERPADSSDMLSDEEFQKWLQEQLDQVEKERKEQQEAIQSNDVLPSASSEDDQSWDDKSWEKLEFSKEDHDAQLLNQGDCSILDEFSVIVPEESKETTSIEMEVIHPAIPETEVERTTDSGDPADSFNMFNELLENDGSLESSILMETVTTSLFGDDLTETVYIHEDEDQQIVLKLVFENGSMYRFRVPRKSYTLDKLKRAVNDKLDQGYEDPVTALKIKYLDDEGDWITIASQEEWEEAVRIHKDVLKVHIM